MDELVGEHSQGDLAAMRRALDLALRGRFTVSPNPMVGCVIVADGHIAGEGWHERAGGPHAEVVALQAAADRARGATVYVTLEPCAHTGRTGPCTQALIDAGVARVVVAAADPSPLARGGADILRAAGIDVVMGCLADEARSANQVFFHGLATGRPFVTAKVAVSLDGRIAAGDGTSQWLTSEAARQQVHWQRAAADAILVGSGTVLADDPQLTCRAVGYHGPQPLRVVLDRRRRVGGHHRMFDDAAATEVFSDHRDLRDVLDRLWRRDVRSVLDEGGATVLHAFLSSNLVDRLLVFVAPVLLGERGRPMIAGPWATTLSEAPRLRLTDARQVDGDALLVLEPLTAAAASEAAPVMAEA